jgi:hypothetical protein
LLIPAATTKNISEPARRQPKISPPARPSLSSHRPPVLVHSIQNLSLSPLLQLSRSPLLRDKDGGEAPLRGSISREVAAALPSSSPSAAALLPSPTSAMAEGGTVAHERADHGTPLFFPIGSGIRRCSGVQAWRPRHSSLLPQRHQQRRSSLLSQQGAPSSFGLYAVAASSRFGPVAASFGATWTRCSLACARRRSSLWVQRSLSAPAASSPASPSPA